MKRLHFIDNLRWVMILFVLSMHAAVTYSNHGSWYYNEVTHLDRGEDLGFLTYQVFLQSFFMGLLFFVAGYFVPGAFDRKGAAHFLRDRGYRLGLPALFYIFIVQPVTCYYAARVWAPGDPSRSFLHEYARYIGSGRFLAGNGPLWFCIALLFFCCIYAAWRTLASGRSNQAGLEPSSSGARTTGPKQAFVEAPGRRFSPAATFAPLGCPRTITITGFIAVIALATFFVRLYWPNGSNFYNMQFGYFSQYVAFFIAGTLAYRHSWLTTLPVRTGKRWGWIGLFGGLILWSALIAAIILGKGRPADVNGGWHWESLCLSTFESLAGAGLSLGCITLFREKFNGADARTAFFSATAFAVYVFHAPILIVITRLMSDWQSDAVLKFLVATVLAIIATYTLSAFVFRRVPILKNIL